MAARYYRQNIAQYNPLSMEEQMFAPMQMRQRHDMMDQQSSALQTSLGEYNALSQDQEFVQNAINPIEQKISELAADLAKNGFDHSKSSALAKLQQEKSKLWSQHGDVGMAQSRHAQFKEESERLRKQYEKNPELANWAINQMAGSKGLTRDESGNIINRGLNTPHMVRHYDAKEVNDILSSQLGSIKATLLNRYGFKNVGSISSIQDVYKTGMEEGRTVEEVEDILLAQLSPEIMASAAQYGNIMMGDPQAGKQMLLQQIRGAAYGGAHTKLTENYSVYTNEDRKFARDQTAKDMQSLILPGARLETSVNEGILKDLKVDGRGNIQSTRQAAIGKAYYEDSKGNKVTEKEATDIILTPDGQRRVPKKGYKLVDTEAATTSDNVKQFQVLKNASPALRNLSDKEALQKMKDHYKTMSQTFSHVDVFKTNFDFIKESLVNNMPNGTFMNDKGAIQNFRDMTRDLGLTEDEVMKSFKPSGTGVRPDIGAVVEGTVLNKKGERVPIFMQADMASNSYVKTATSVVDHLMKNGTTGKIHTQYTDPETGRSVIGNELYMINNFDGNPLIIETTADLTPNKLQEMANAGSREGITRFFSNPGAVKIYTPSEYTGQAARQMREILQGNKY